MPVLCATATLVVWDGSSLSGFVQVGASCKVSASTRRGGGFDQWRCIGPSGGCSGCGLKGKYVRTLYREGAPRYLLCAVRGQSVRVALHRDRAPAARPAARGQGAHQPLPALARLGRVHPQADRRPHHHPREGLHLGRPSPLQRVQARARLRRRGGRAALPQAHRHGTSVARPAARGEVLRRGDPDRARPAPARHPRRAAAHHAGEGPGAAGRQGPAQRAEPAWRSSPAT